MKAYIEKILMPYISCKRKELKVGTMYPALVVFDNFTGQMVNIMKLLEENVYVVNVPANCTDRLQPMDISVNKAAKSFL